MKAVFIDTSYYIAFLNTNDLHHAKAKELALQLSSAQLVVTTEHILVELGNYFCRQRGREVCGAFIQNVLDGNEVQIIPSTTLLLRRGIQLYCNRPDKTWSLTDCISILVMQDKGLLEVLSTDQHFEQAGFKCLLKP